LERVPLLYGEASVFSTKLVKAFFSGKQGTEWKETARMETKVKKGVIKGCKIIVY
jgi:hypothetical protein